MSEADAPVVSLDDVTVDFRDVPLIEQALPDSLVERFNIGEEPVRAVENVSFNIDEGDALVLVGESGSGKSTLGRTAVGIQEPTSGSVTYRSYDIQNVESGAHAGDIYFENVRRALQIVHQDPNAALNPYRTVRSTLSQPLERWYPEMDLADRRERIGRMLKTVGITPAEEYMERYPHELSGGEKQRVAIIRAMLVEPDLILLDEIVSALDVSLRVEIMDLLLELQEMFDTSYIFISHNLTNARYFAERADGRIAVMYLGNLVEIGSAEEIVQNPTHPYTKILKWASLPLDPAAGRKTLKEESPMMTEEAPDPSNPPSGCRFHEACPVAREACTAEKPTLEDSGEGHQTACFREQSDHPYWESEPIHESAPDLPE